MAKIIIMSDTHFGNRDSNLTILKDFDREINNTRKKKIDQFFSWLGTEHEEVDEFILLGDIFDLHLHKFMDAIIGSQYFFEKLSKVKNLKNISYLPGNHDHTIWLLHIYHNDIIKRLESSDALNISEELNFVYKREFKSSDSPSFLNKVLTMGSDVELKVKYPLMKRTINGKHFAFFHGHFLQKRQRVIEKLFKMITPKLDLTQLQEFELFCSPQHEAFFLLSQCQTGRDELSVKYKKLKKYTGDYRKDVVYHHRNIREHLNETGEMIDSNPIYKKLDYVIFGHTHKAGISQQRFSKNKKLIGMNTGSWEEQGLIFGEFILIDKDKINDNHPELYEFKRNYYKPVLHEQYIELIDGFRPSDSVFDEKLSPWSIF